MIRRILLDTNIVLDVLLARGPARYADEVVIRGCDDGRQCFVTASAVTDIYYMLRQYGMGDMMARRAMQKLFERVLLLDTRGNDCRWALKSEIRDFEDAVQVETAAREEIDVIVSRDRALKRAGLTIPVVTPKEFVEEYAK